MGIAAALDILPKRLRSRSFSQDEIVLPYREALEAIRLLEEKDWAIISWEGWLSYPDGRLGHSSQFQGTVEVMRSTEESWESYVQRAAQLSRETILDAVREWDLTQGNSDEKLLFCLTAWSEEEEEHSR